MILFLLHDDAIEMLSLLLTIIVVLLRLQSKYNTVNGVWLNVRNIDNNKKQLKNVHLNESIYFAQESD